MTDRATRRPLADCRVLIVEDEYFIADDMAQAVHELGADVVGPVQTTEGALQLISRGDIDIAVLDVNLSGRSVFCVAEVLAKRQIPFVFATGYDENSFPSAYRNAPRWEKPFNPLDLARALPRISRPS